MATHKHSLNQKNNQLKLAVLLIGIGALPQLFHAPDTYNWITGLSFGIGAGLFVAAALKLRVWPEKQA